MSAALLLVALAGPPARSPYFVIRAVDGATGRGVPLVHLRAVDGTTLVTDSAGVAVYNEPGMMGRPAHFTASSPGYELPPDGFGIRGRKLVPVAGRSAKLRLNRLNIAERLYRVTGAGIYRDSYLAGKACPIREPLINGRVVGCDSVLTATYRGRLYWVWGDTLRPDYPLGNFHASGATSRLPGQGGLAPSVGVDLMYLVNGDGFAAEMCKMPGAGPTWITSLFPLGAGKEQRLVAVYIKVKPPLTAYSRGLAVFDDGKRRFVHLRDLPFTAPAHPGGQALLHRGHVYFCTPYPLVRVPASFEAVQKAGSYEAFSCFKQGTKEVERDGKGRVVYGWKKNTAPVGPGEQERLERAGKLKPGEGLLRLTDVKTGKRVFAHGGSVAYNPHRKRWTMIAVQKGGAASFLGEVWYAEADDLTGPWEYAVQVATHPRHDFYNPRQHPQFEEGGGRFIYFEGTFTNTFSGNPVKVPRYEYNQLMYRLDLADARLALPVQQPGGFYALERQAPGTVPVKGTSFFAYPTRGEAPAGLVPLYATEKGHSTTPLKGARPLARVWAGPR